MAIAIQGATELLELELDQLLELEVLDQLLELDEPRSSDVIV